MSGIDEIQVDAIMESALSNGIDYFDHADIYEAFTFNGYYKSQESNCCLSFFVVKYL